MTIACHLFHRLLVGNGDTRSAIDSGKQENRGETKGVGHHGGLLVGVGHPVDDSSTGEQSSA